MIERKKHIKHIYDGNVFQLYAQCFSMREAGFIVRRLQLRSMDDNKAYDIDLPENNNEMFVAFKRTIEKIMTFNLEKFEQTNIEKCRHCIYESICDRTLL